VGKISVVSSDIEIRQEMYYNGTSKEVITIRGRLTVISQFVLDGVLVFLVMLLSLLLTGAYSRNSPCGVMMSCFLSGTVAVLTVDISVFNAGKTSLIETAVLGGSVLAAAFVAQFIAIRGEPKGERD